MKNKMKSLTVFLLALALALSCLPGCGLAEEAEGEYETYFEHWNMDAPALNALIDYVEAVTDEASPDYIPEKDRIATFDMDGTLCAELNPTYLEYYLLAQRILKDPAYQPDAETLEFGRMLRDHALDKSFPDGMDLLHATYAAKAYAGMTLEEFADFVTRMIVREADGFEGMTYASAFYIPMVEVVEYLQDNGFTCYICSGSDRFICRTYVEGMLDIPYENVIGMDVALEAANQGEADGLNYVFTAADHLVRTDRLLIKNLKTNKVLQIAQEIGRQPVLSFGNSSGDVSMHNYALYNNPYKSAAFMLVADDDARDYGNPEKAQGLREKWDAAGFNVISMANDWTTIYGEDVVKTGVFNWLEDLAEDRIPAEEETEPEAEKAEAYQLKQVVVFSRHNIRSPLAEKGSLVSDLTPHEWFDWTSKTGELSLRGAMLETTMGQYFRLWLEKEGLFPENYIPKDGAVRFYANSLQRTQATARYFSAGLLPVAVVPVERHMEYNQGDGVFLPLIRFITDDYAKDIEAELVAHSGGESLDAYRDQLSSAISLLMDVVDMDESEAYTSGKYGNLLADETQLTLAEGDEPRLSGPIKTAVSLSDALVLQYYEEPDDLKAAFGHELTEDDWKAIGGILATYEEILFESPLLASNLAHPILKEIYAELNAQGREFSFLCGHDSTIASILAALGVNDYELPGAIEPTTPIGSKIVFERWVNEKGESFFKVELIYQSVEQLRSIQPLSLDTPPMIVPLTFAGVEVNGNGLMAEKDLMNLLREKINALDEIVEKYTAEELDDAA